METGRDVVDRLYTLAGGSSLYAKSPLQRYLRDLHTASQHMMVAQPTWELTGRVLLGLDGDPMGCSPADDLADDPRSGGSALAASSRR